MISGKTIFIAPIDWGMGHASRCVPLIEKLKIQNKVLLGVTNNNAFFFKHYFPDLTQLPLPSYHIRYARVLPLWFKLALQAPSILRSIKHERRLLRDYVHTYNIDLVVSDNRFGLYHEKTRNIFVTHQLSLKAPVLVSLANHINRQYIHRFQEVWVPDYAEPDKRLSGTLSDHTAMRVPITFIGPQSALSVCTAALTQDRYDYLFLLSGPEPQRTLLEELVFEKVKSLAGRIAVVRGTAVSSKRLWPTGSVELFDFLTGDDLYRVLGAADQVICRSGYSSLMDLHYLKKKNLLLVPTPGQTEQEYLAVYWQQKFGAKALLQRDFINGF